MRDDTIIEIKKNMHNIINEVFNLKIYNKNIANNISNKNFENFVDKQRKNIIIFQNEVEKLYDEINLNINQK